MIGKIVYWLLFLYYSTLGSNINFFVVILSISHYSFTIPFSVVILILCGKLCNSTEI